MIYTLQHLISIRYFSKYVKVNGQMLAPENNLIANSNHSIIRTISLLEDVNNVRITVIDQAGIVIQPM